MKKNVTQKLIDSHLVEGELRPGKEIGLIIDQTLTQDATGTMVMLELEAMKIPRVKTELSAQYVDHNLLQSDFKNADDHLFLQSACKKFGIWFSRPGNGVSHPVHMERFGIPGKTLLGSDSHTCAAGSLGMLAIGAGGLEVATAMAGKPFFVKMPQIWGVKLNSKLPDWVSAKDVILEMLRRHGVAGGVGKIIEYYGPGLESLSAMDRHVIANMGAELGATTTVFPSDEITKAFMKEQDRPDDWIEMKADSDAEYDLHDEIDLSSLVPLIALPSSPGNVVPVEEVAGKEIYQAMVGSSANPGFRDFAIPALMVEDKQVNESVSFDINPTSRAILKQLASEGYFKKLIDAGARIHQPGCNGCIGMGQAPASGQISLRTVPRNFPGRSGTKEDQVYLCSPETATASALKGVITDPRTLDIKYPIFKRKISAGTYKSEVVEPAQNGDKIELKKGPNIKSLPEMKPTPQNIKAPVLIKVGDDISTDEIMPAGSRVLPFRSNIQEISKFVFEPIDENYYKRAMENQKNGSFIVSGENYGQGSSREHAALAPRYLGVKAVFAKSFARIHFQNLINFGIIPLTFSDKKDFNNIDAEDILSLDSVPKMFDNGNSIEIKNYSKNETYKMDHSLSERQIKILLAGGLINIIQQESVSKN